MSNGSVAAIFTSMERVNAFCDALRIGVDEREPLSRTVFKCRDRLYVMMARSLQAVVDALPDEQCTRMYFDENYVFDTSPLAYHVTAVEDVCDLWPLEGDEKARVQERMFEQQQQQQNETFESFFMRRLGANGGHFQLLIEEAPAPNRASPPPSKIPREWKKRLRADAVEPANDVAKADDECIICVEGNKRTVLFVPCDHLVCCDACAHAWMENNPTCPVCREPVQDVRRIKK